MGKLVDGKYYEDKEDSLKTLVSIDCTKSKKINFIGETYEYFDKVNGNSYWSCRVENIDLDRTYVFPFQYGYGDQSEYVVKKALGLQHHQIKFIKHLNCTKKKTKDWGTALAENFISDLGYYYCD